MIFVGGLDGASLDSGLGVAGRASVRAVVACSRRCGGARAAVSAGDAHPADAGGGVAHAVVGGHEGERGAARAAVRHALFARGGGRWRRRRRRALARAVHLDRQVGRGRDRTPSSSSCAACATRCPSLARRIADGSAVMRCCFAPPPASSTTSRECDESLC